MHAITIKKQSYLTVTNQERHCLFGCTFIYKLLFRHVYAEADNTYELNAGGVKILVISTDNLDGETALTAAQAMNTPYSFQSPFS